MTHSGTRWTLVGWALVLLVGLGFSRVQADDDACQIATKGDSPIAKACKKGGRKAAGKAMKAAVKAAKAKGVVFRCDGCHADMDTYELKPNAQDDLGKLLEASRR